ncbi:MAG: transporter substrate-binding domain-containing protein [Clostridiales bacterium]|nr:transporter substrate-binding domain-containing protein [Clostridiales bacterium]
MKKDGTMAQISTTWFGSDMTTVKETADIKTPATDNSLEKVLEAKKLVLGLDATFKPMGFTDDQNNIVGFDIDLAKEVCKRLGVELELKGIDWETKEKTLDANQIDCIWNGMSYSDKRNEAMNLSEAYMDNKMVFVVSASGAIASQADLSQKKVAVQSGSTAQEILEASAIAKDIEIVAIGTNVEALQQLNLNMVDAVFLDSVVAEYEIVQMLKTK